MEITILHFSNFNVHTHHLRIFWNADSEWSGMRWVDICISIKAMLVPTLLNDLDHWKQDNLEAHPWPLFLSSQPNHKVGKRTFFSFINFLLSLCLSCPWPHLMLMLSWSLLWTLGMEGTAEHWKDLTCWLDQNIKALSLGILTTQVFSLRKQMTKCVFYIYLGTEIFVLGFNPICQISSGQHSWPLSVERNSCSSFNIAY